MDEPRPLPYRDGDPERGAIRDAVIELSTEVGIAALTIDAVCERAEVSAAAFACHFGDLDGACIEIYQEDIDELDRLIFGAYDRASNWRDGIRAAGYAAARFFSDRPLDTRFALIEMFATGEAAQARRDHYLRRLIDLVDRGRLELADPDSLSRATAENTIGSVVALLYKQVREHGNAAHADQFVPGLMYMAVRPYLGHEVALEELGIPPPPRVGEASETI